MITDAAGSVTATRAYDPWGRLEATTGTATSAFGFAGEYMDVETGFTFLRARYYDPATAQFLSRDPLVDLTGQAYAYADNDPVNKVDPLGLFCIAGKNPNGSCRGSGAVKTAGRFVSEHIGEIGVAAGCAIGFATAQTGVGLILAAATCETAIGLAVLAERTGDNVANGRAGVLYACGSGLVAAAVQLNPVGVLLAVNGCVLAAGVQAAAERQDLRNSGLRDACYDPRAGG